jgi:hypothetical protein
MRERASVHPVSTISTPMVLLKSQAGDVKVVLPFE